MVADQPALSIASQDLEESLEDGGVLVIHLLLACKICGFTFTNNNVFIATCDEYHTTGAVVFSMPYRHKKFGSSYVQECDIFS